MSPCSLIHRYEHFTHTWCKIWKAAGFSRMVKQLLFHIPVLSHDGKQVYCSHLNIISLEEVTQFQKYITEHMTLFGNHMVIILVGTSVTLALPHSYGSNTSCHHFHVKTSKFGSFSSLLLSRSHKNCISFRWDTYLLD
jgi:hypothetical protein